MKALIKKEGREGLWLTDVPAPTIGDRDVLIRVRRAAICGTACSMSRASQGSTTVNPGMARIMARSSVAWWLGP